MSVSSESPEMKIPESETTRRGSGRYPELEYLSDRLLDAIQVGLIFFDDRKTILRTNTQAREDLRIDCACAGKEITDLLSVIYNNNDILPGVLSKFEKPGTELFKLPAHTFVRTRDGKTQFFVSGSVALLESGNYLFSFRNTMDEITREQILGMALAQTKIFPWFYDMERNKMLIDAHWFAHLGIPAGDCTLSSEAFFELVHPDDRETLSSALRKQLSDHEITDLFDYRLRRGDGTWEWFEEQSVYLSQTDDGSPYRIVGVCQSIQDHKDIEDSLRLARDKAEQSDRLKSAFLANMSHEIRTPLNAIVGFSNLLTEGSVVIDSNEGREYVELINKNCNYLLTLISDILDLSRIESNTMEFAFSKQEFHSLMQDIYQMHRLNIPSRIKFSLLLPDEQVVLETDPVRLRQVMDNLLVNAVKFTQEGRIDIGYAASDDGTSVELFVEDTGCGIPEDQYKRIFDRFHKVDSFVQGAGLGLSICKTIAEQLGGTIFVDSCVGKGSRFMLRLPLKRAASNR